MTKRVHASDVGSRVTGPMNARLPLLPNLGSLPVPRTLVHSENLLFGEAAGAREVLGEEDPREDPGLHLAEITTLAEAIGTQPAGVGWSNDGLD